MPVTTSWKVFNQRLIDNGSLKKTIQKRTNDKIITYDPNTNKVTYQMILCLGLLPDELVDDKLIEPIYKHLHMKRMKNDVLQIHKDQYVTVHPDPNDLSKDVKSIFISSELKKWQIKMFEKCWSDNLHNTPGLLPKTYRGYIDLIMNGCHCNHNNGNQCCYRSKEHWSEVEYRVKNHVPEYIPYMYYNGLNFRMCCKHYKEFMRSPLSHKKRMIQNQLENVNLHVNKYGYLLRGNPHWK
jgi:hypothetical protein